MEEYILLFNKISDAIEKLEKLKQESLFQHNKKQKKFLSRKNEKSVIGAILL